MGTYRISGSLQWESKSVKCTLVQALRLCTDRTAHRGTRGIALLFLDHGTRRGEGSASRPSHSLPLGKDAVPFLQEAGWTPGAENLAEFDSWTVQSVASRYTDYATRPTYSGRGENITDFHAPPSHLKSDL